MPPVQRKFVRAINPLFYLKKLLSLFKVFDQKLEEKLSFFVRHYGKSKFMIQMSKKAQIYGLEKLFHKGPKAFFYFFMFYLIRDVILYIIIPIYFMKFWE